MGDVQHTARLALMAGWEKGLCQLIQACTSHCCLLGLRSQDTLLNKDSTCSFTGEVNNGRGTGSDDPEEQEDRQHRLCRRSQGGADIPSTQVSRSFANKTQSSEKIGCLGNMKHRVERTAKA